jgi:acyl dehydratase
LPDQLLYFDDIRVGQTFTTREETVTADAIVAFGEAFDPQPQHLGEAAARASIFGQLVASGWHTGALTMRLMLSSNAPRFAAALGLGIERVSWPTPTRPGDALHVVTEILEMRPSRSRPDRGIIRMRTVTHNQHGEIVMECTHTVMALRRVATRPPA